MGPGVLGIVLTGEQYRRATVREKLVTLNEISLNLNDMFGR